MEIEVLNEGVANTELANTCCAGGAGNARK